jgi:hypothetical protein
VQPLINSRLLAFSMLAFLVHSGAAAADCARPEWKDPASFQGQPREARDAMAFAFVNRIHEFIVCRRSSLEKRASGLGPAAVQALIQKDRADEDRALAEAERIFFCTGAAGQPLDPTALRSKCDTYIEWARDSRRPTEPPSYEVLESEQRSEFGGVWSFRTLDFGRPGQCNHAQCPKVLGVEVTNMTPVVLRCDVALTISNRQDGEERGRKLLTLYPGDSFPAARVSSYRDPEHIQPEVNCSAARPLPPDLSIPASCVLNWLPRSPEYPKRFGRGWSSGTALVEFSTGQRHQTVEAIRVVQADTLSIGEAAQELIGKLSASTNCAGQRFRMRVEYRAYTCYGCFFESGSATMTRDDRLLPESGF